MNFPRKRSCRCLNWMNDLDKNAGIYIHIPFCKKKCGYCDFYSLSSLSQKSEYIKALVNEIRNHESFPKIKSIYIGGGTPSVLSENEIYEIFKALNNKFNIDSNAEITVEVNPESVNKEFLNSLKHSGVNRISMGIQSLKDNELSLLGRLSSAQMCINAYESLILSGISNISIDIMLAVPQQDKESLEFTLKKVSELNPNHISAYLLKLDNPADNNGLYEAPEEIQSELYLYTANFLKNLGYKHYEISNYAKEGFQSKHNLNYWNGGQYLAFGCGAYGFFNNTRYHIHPDINEYINKNGMTDIVIDEIMTMETLKEEKIILKLRTAEGIEKSFLGEPQIRYLGSENLKLYVNESETSFSLTERGFLVSNTIISQVLKLSC